MDRDLYGVLGVPSTASEAEIRHAFRELAKRRHPDINRDDPDAAHEFIEVKNAADILLDPQRRATYDERTRPVTPVPPSAPEAPPPVPKPAPGQAPADAAAPPARAPGVSGIGAIWGTLLVICAIAAVITLLASSPRQHNADGPVNGSVMWKATGFRLNDGWGINLPGHGSRLQVFPGTSTDLEVDSGYLSSAGRIAFLPRGATATYKECLSAVQQTTDQAKSLREIMPTTHGDLCSSGASGDVAHIRVTRSDSSGISLSITVWKNI